MAIGISRKNLDKRQVDPSFAIGWASREKFRHFEVILSDRKSLIQPFAYLASKLNPPPTKTSFAPLGLGTRKVKE
jgi:NF-kappa-B inhibitor-interacting Ras-like protein